LQCVAACCSVLQCVAEWFTRGLHVEFTCDSRCSVLQCVAVCCSVLQRVAVCCRVIHTWFTRWIHTWFICEMVSAHFMSRHQMRTTLVNDTNLIVLHRVLHRVLQVSFTKEPYSTVWMIRITERWPSVIRMYVCEMWNVHQCVDPRARWVHISHIYLMHIHGTLKEYLDKMQVVNVHTLKEYLPDAHSRLAFYLYTPIIYRSVP